MYRGCGLPSVWVPSTWYLHVFKRPSHKTHTIFDILRIRDTTRTTYDDFSLSPSNASYRFEDMQTLARPMLQHLYVYARVKIALQRGTSPYIVICQVPRGRRGMSTLQGRHGG